jgi:hypothetical protein
LFSLDAEYEHEIVIDYSEYVENVKATKIKKY